MRTRMLSNLASSLSVNVLLGLFTFSQKSPVFPVKKPRFSTRIIFSSFHSFVLCIRLFLCLLYIYCLITAKYTACSSPFQITFKVIVPNIFTYMCKLCENTKSSLCSKFKNFNAYMWKIIKMYRYILLAQKGGDDSNLNARMWIWKWRKKGGDRNKL